MDVIDRAEVLAMIGGIKSGPGNGPNWQFGFHTALEVVKGAIAALPSLQSGEVEVCRGTLLQDSLGAHWIDTKQDWDWPEYMRGRLVQVIIRPVAKGRGEGEAR